MSKVDRILPGANKGLLLRLLLIVLTRLPLLFLGYGSDGDGWRVAWSAGQLWHEGIYQPSRYPGFPVYEILNAPLVGLGGSVLSNAATLVVFLCALLLFRKLILKLNVPSSNLLVWMFAFLPILWKNSAITLDYIWGLALILLSFLLVIEKKYLIAAVILGIAVGTRLTNGIFLIPMFFLLEKETRRKVFFQMTIVSGMTSLACYLPVILRPELWADTLKYLADVREYTLVQRIGFFVYRSVYALGFLGSLSIAVFLFRSRNALWEGFRLKDHRLQMCVSAIALMLSMFFILADEREYLIPVIPFLLIVLGIILPQKSLKVIALCLFSYAFLTIDVISHEFNNQRLVPNLSSGIVVKDWSVRQRYYDWRKELATYPLKDSSIVMIANGPIFWVENPLVVTSEAVVNTFHDEDVAVSREKPNLFYVYSLSRSGVQEFRARGYEIYYIAGMKRYLESFLHYDLDSAGAIPLDIPVP